MAESAIQICNLALLRIGEKQQIGSLTENNVPSRACNTLYPITRDTLLAKHDWKWARKHAPLALLSYQRSGFLYAYALPADAVKAIYVSNGLRPGASYPLSSIAYNAFAGTSQSLQSFSAPSVPFDIELGDGGSRILLTDQQAAELVYTSNAVAPGAMSQLFVDALAWQLAVELGLALPNVAAKAQAFQAKANSTLLEAMAQGMRESKEDPQPPSRFISSRW